MQLIGPVVNQLISMLLIILLGGFLRKKELLNKEITDGLFMLAIKIGLPAAVITSIQGTMYSADTFKTFLIVFIGSIFCMILGTILTILCCIPLKVKYPEKGVWIASSVAPNSGFIGIPLLFSIYGEPTLFLTAASLFAASAFGFSILMHFVHKSDGKTGRKRNLSEIIRPFNNSVLLSTLFAFLLYLLSIRLSGPILNTLRMISVISPPLAMIAIGSTLAMVKIKKSLADYRIYFVSFLKLIAMPLAGYVCLSPFIKDKLILNVIIICAALPTGNSIPAIARHANNDETLASTFVVATTIFSMITITFIAWIVL